MELLVELLALRNQVVREARELLEEWRPALHRRAFLPSAANLAHYIALRRRDLRGLQEASEQVEATGRAHFDGLREHATVDNFIPLLVYRLTKDELLQGADDELHVSA